MAYDFEEQEKLDSLKEWWHRYGTLCVIVACLVAAGILGWRGWQWYEQNQNIQAMGYYEALQRATQQDDDASTERLLAASQTLRTDYAKSAYASRGALLAGHALRERNDLGAAREQYEWLMNSNDPAIAPIGRLNLALILVDEENFDDAHQVLSTTPEAGFEALYLDRQGDVFYAQKDLPQARSKWQAALAANTDPAYAEILQLKLDATED